MPLRTHLNFVSHNGIGSWIQLIGLRAVRRVLEVRVKVVYVISGPTAGVVVPEGVTISVAEPESLLRLSADPQWDLTRSFLKQAQRRGDVCALASIDGRPVGYAWYAKREALSLYGVLLRFPEDLVYAYKYYTLPEFRGQRIQRYVTAWATTYFGIGASRRLILFIESWNTASIRATVASGGRRVGWWVYAMRRDNYHGWMSRGCRELGVTAIPPGAITAA